MRRVSQGLTTAQWHLMECLWAKAPQSGRELVKEMTRRQGWNRSTTLTMLRRMCEKEQIACEETEGIRVYRPLIDREEALSQETDSFLKRAYNGSVSMMVSAMTKKQELSREEIEELYAILRQAEGKEEGK